MLAATLHGIILAFGLIMALGVQNIYIFNQGLVHRKFLRVLPAVVTAAISDTFLIVIAVLGVSAFIFTFPSVRFILVGAGVLFISYLGWTHWRTPVQQSDENLSKDWTPKRQIVFALSVSLLNPHAILDTVGVIGTTSSEYAGQEKIAFTLACIVVSWLWFLLLAYAGRVIGTLRSIRKWLNRVSAIIMWASALYLASTLFS